MVIAVYFFDRHVRQDVVLRRLGEYCARSRIELGDIVRAFLNLLDADSYSPRDLRETPLAQILHVIGDDLVFQAVLPSFALELDQQTLAQISRAHARRMKTLDQREHVL